MRTRNLGASGLKVSELCLGAMTFGDADADSFMHQITCDERTSYDIMDRALDAGVNFIDTADVYGQDGLSERVVGNWFASRGRRNDVVLATKFRFTMKDGPNGKGASRYRIIQCCEDSLRRLRTDRIDLYQIHMQDLDTPEDETLRALDDLVRQGKVHYIGCSNYAAYRLAQSLATSRHRGWERFVALQAQYSLLIRGLEREHVPLCLDEGVGILPWSPLAGGFLTGKYQKGQEPSDGSRYARWKERYDSYDSERNWTVLSALTAVAEETKSTPAAVALAWLLAKPVVSSVIFGARTVAQLEDNLKAVDVELSAAQVSRLDDASKFELGYPYDFIQGFQGRW